MEVSQVDIHRLGLGDLPIISCVGHHQFPKSGQRGNQGGAAPPIQASCSGVRNLQQPLLVWAEQVWEPLYMTSPSV